MHPGGLNRDAFLGILHEQLFEQVQQLSRKQALHSHYSNVSLQTMPEEIPEMLITTLCHCPRGHSTYHDEDGDPNSPRIHGPACVLIAEHLRSDVVWFSNRPAEPLIRGASSRDRYGEAEVDDAHIAVGAEHEVPH